MAFSLACRRVQVDRPSKPLGKHWPQSFYNAVECLEYIDQVRGFPITACVSQDTRKDKHRKLEVRSFVRSLEYVQIEGDSDQRKASR